MNTQQAPVRVYLDKGFGISIQYNPTGVRNGPLDEVVGQEPR